MRHIDVEFDNVSRSHEELRDFGFDDGFARGFAETAASGFERSGREPSSVEPGRVVESRRGLSIAVCALPFGEDDGEGDGPKTRSGADRALAGASAGVPRALREIEAVPSGALAGLPPPVAGDWVVLADADGRWGRAVVKAVLPRRNAILRKAPGDPAYDKIEAQALAANVDDAFIVMAAGRDWNPRRLERYLALVRDSGVEPVTVISKADLADDPEALRSEAEGITGGALCALVCAPEGRGLEPLQSRLGPGRTVVLLGSSGAGKSTLLNALAGGELARTACVRADDQRGRHTTTNRQLYRLPHGGMIIDTPGLRELQLLLDEDAVAGAFPDIEALAAGCRFRDCSHASEPGCAVRAALESGELDSGRFGNYRKLAREAAFLAQRGDSAARRAEQERWKAINKSMRGYSKERRSIQGRSR